VARKTKYSDGFFAFVHEQGLVIGDEASFAAARRKYLAECKRKSKQEIRKRCHAFEVLLTAQELSVVERKARTLGVSVTRFIKMAALAEHQPMANPATIGEVRQLLLGYYTYLQALFEEANVEENIGEEILQQAEETERRILRLLHHS
jgi:hypothetical protein